MSSPNPFFVTRLDCPVCLCRETIPVYKRSYQDARMQEYVHLEYRGHMESDYLQGLDFEIAECTRCMFMFQRHVPNAHGARRLFDVWIDPVFAEQWNQENAFNPALAHSTLQFATAFLSRPRIRLLDYGAGFGDFACFARDKGLDVSALEISDTCQAALRKRGLPTFQPGQEPARHYDFINLDYVLEHVGDPFGVLQAVHRALKDDGLVFLSVHDCRGLRKTLANVDALPIQQYKLTLSRCAAIQHVNGFTNATLKRLCRRAGLSPVFRPILFFRTRVRGGGPKALLKNIARPFYRYCCGTSLFLKKGSH